VVPTKTVLIWENDYLERYLLGKLMKAAESACWNLADIWFGNCNEMYSLFIDDDSWSPFHFVFILLLSRQYRHPYAKDSPERKASRSNLSKKKWKCD
jgi:hypothetical protein